MNVTVWLVAISVLLLAGCDSSVSITAISNPPIPSTTQAAPQATLQNGFFVQGTVLCVVVTAEYTCGSTLAPVTASWAASTLPVTKLPQAPGRPSPSAPESPQPVFSGSLDGVSGYYITVDTSGSIFTQMTTGASGNDSTLMGLVTSTANPDGSYSFTGKLIMQSGTVDVAGEAALFDVDAGLSLALYAVSSDGQTRVAVIGEAAQ
jgi:hypothetical protein